MEGKETDSVACALWKRAVDCRSGYAESPEYLPKGPGDPTAGVYTHLGQGEGGGCRVPSRTSHISRGRLLINFHLHLGWCSCN